MRGLTIRATVGTPVLAATSDGRVHLDSVLAFAANYPNAHQLPALRERVVCPEIPGLLCLWRSSQGLPLWACSDLAPAGLWTQGREYAHRRYPSHRADRARKVSANTAAGQYKEARKQLLTTSATHWQAQCIGDVDAIRSLLAGITHIGSRSSIYGRVLRWEIEPDDAVTAQTILARRPVPVAAMELLLPDVQPTRINPQCPWTPPYWYAPWNLPCMEPETCSSPL